MDKHNLMPGERLDTLEREVDDMRMSVERIVELLEAIKDSVIAVIAKEDEQSPEFHMTDEQRMEFENDQARIAYGE